MRSVDKEVDPAMIVEVSQFRLVPGTDEQAFLEASEETQSVFLGKQEGFVSRDLLRTDDGSWMDIVRFETGEAALAAFQGFAGQPGVKNFESMLDANSVSMTHWSVAKSW
jgi:Antibiotic biosynthesis monooxygenase